MNWQILTHHGNWVEPFRAIILGSSLEYDWINTCYLKEPSSRATPCNYLRFACLAVGKKVTIIIPQMGCSKWWFTLPSWNIYKKSPTKPNKSVLLLTSWIFSPKTNNSHPLSHKNVSCQVWDCKNISTSRGVVPGHESTTKPRSDQRRLDQQQPTCTCCGPKVKSKSFKGPGVDEPSSPGENHRMTFSGRIPWRKKSQSFGKSEVGSLSTKYLRGLEGPSQVVGLGISEPSTVYFGRWFLLGGSSQLGSVVHDHRIISPLRIELWDPFQMAELHGL